MQRLILIFTLIVFAAAGYLFLQPPPDTQLENANTPPSVSEETRREAQSHINSLTQQAAEQTLNMNEADHFVKGNQLLKLPETEAQAADAIQLEAPAASSSVKTFAASRTTTGSSNAPQVSDQLSKLDRLRLQELLNNPDQASNEVFYIHSVDGADQQGLWGIIHQGLIETFTRGIRIDDRSRLLSVAIPEDADEPLADKRSSWLGTLLKDKVETTWVYNYQQGLLGQNPNVIHPGQQLIIVRFDEDELIDIYNHFTHAQ
ncbi:hypothetical protein H9C73_04390 [Marinobacterium sp. AK62]|uniref:Uncharacterized protein n=1 Tax=Marinobacterium alkalitolerans TaxID=1542925 RepID=A0ABS3Z8C9_9GAMM|nr:hypothetical protein [Marinobacterium alkalitolerans]MBP0047962.1 hypothetical protein [Marinobacterium alkalitolerans]